MTNLRTIVALETAKPLVCKPVEQPPKIAWLPLEVLRIDETYQRGLSENSVVQIRKMAQHWQWPLFKPLTVSPLPDGLYEILDGQHEAIAAATNGLIASLPCMVHEIATRAERAAAFVGLNRQRIQLTPFALFRAQLAGGDQLAMNVDQALRDSGATLFDTYRYDREYEVGAVNCIKTLQVIVKKSGPDVLTRLLKIAVAGEVAPIPGALLRAMQAIITDPARRDQPEQIDGELIFLLLENDAETLADEARANARNNQIGLAEAWVRNLARRLTPPPPRNLRTRHFYGWPEGGELRRAA